MGIKQSIVVVNEFSVNGSRGSTPGNYILSYMGRDDATENLSTVCMFDTVDSVEKYADRSTVCDDALSSDLFGLESVKSVQDDFYSMRIRDGVAFGYGSVSLTNKDLRKHAKEIQTAHDKGKTVMKTVISFACDYLKEMNVVDKDFEVISEGDYKGNIDQMKLRMAIMEGMDNLSHNYDDLRYIGILQMDTENVHCHLAMVDMGEGTLKSDGTQRGMLTDKEKRRIRNGIDSYFKENQYVKIMTSSRDYNMRNEFCFIKQCSMSAIKDHGAMQFILACLPEDRSLWNSHSDNRLMDRANAVTKTYAESVISESSIISEGEQKISNDEIIDNAIDGVYSVLKDIPSDDLTVSVPSMDRLASSTRDLALSLSKKSDINEFSYRFKSYTGRLEHHRHERRRYHDAVTAYDNAMENDAYDTQSIPVRNFFYIEEQYNEMLIVKYMNFLPFEITEDIYSAELKDYLQYRNREQTLIRMDHDEKIISMRADVAENYGLQVYGESGGRDIIMNPSAFKNKIEVVSGILVEKRDALQSVLADHGLSFNVKNATVSRSSKYKFDDVKSLDLHHLAYDFSSDSGLSRNNIIKFAEMSDKRFDAFSAAKNYLVNTGQDSVLEQFEVSDILRQRDLAEKLRNNPVLMSERRDVPQKLRSRNTIPLDYDRYAELESMMRNKVLNSITMQQYA